MLASPGCGRQSGMAMGRPTPSPRATPAVPKSAAEGVAGAPQADADARAIAGAGAAGTIERCAVATSGARTAGSKVEEGSSVG